MEAAPKPDGAPETRPAKSGLPSVESPPLSPAGESPALAADTPDAAITPLAAAVPAARPRLIVKARYKRYALLAATVAVAAALGAVVGALASGGFSASARGSAAAMEESRAMQQSIARLGKEIAALKVGLEQANGSAHSQVAKISERLDRASAEVTGSIAAPQTTVPQAATPLPIPRPAPRAAASEAQAPVRLTVVPNWTIRDARNGYVFVENHGDIYQVALGAPLPGLGPVQAIRRQDGRWMVVTPRGVIIAMRDRRYFEDF